MEAWIEYSQGRLPWGGAVADQDYVTLRGLQMFASHKTRIENERHDRSERKRRSKQLTHEAKALSSRGGLPPGITPSRSDA